MGSEVMGVAIILGELSFLVGLLFWQTFSFIYLVLFLLLHFFVMVHLIKLSKTNMAARTNVSVVKCFPLALAAITAGFEVNRNSSQKRKDSLPRRVTLG